MGKIKAPPPGFRLLQTFKGEGVWFGHVKWAPRGRRLAVGASDNAIWVWDAEVGEFLCKVEGGSGSPVDFAWLGQGTILTWNEGEEFRCQTVHGAKSRRLELEGLHGKIAAVDCSPDGRKIVAITNDKKLRLWDVRTGKLLEEEQENWDVRLIMWSPRGGQIAFLGEGSAWLRNPGTEERQMVLNSHSYPFPPPIAWSPDAKLIAGGQGNVVVLWSVETASYVQRLKGHKKEVKSISFSADGSLLASKSDDGTVRLWRTDQWRLVEVLKEPTTEGKWPPGLSFHPRSSILATLGENDTEVRVWNLNLLSPSVEQERRSLKAAERECSRLSSLEKDYLEWIVIRRENLTHIQAKRHLSQGLLQRLNIMAASRERIFKETHKRGNLLDIETTVDLNVRLNAYYLNLSGALDNLAWSLAYEFELLQGIDEDNWKHRRFCNLFGQDFLSALSQSHPKLAKRLRLRRRWNSEIKEFRDPAAHRIPLYVTPGIHTDEHKERREELSREYLALAQRGDSGRMLSVQYEIRNLAEYRPAFITSNGAEIQMYWLAGQVQKDQRIFLKLLHAVLSELFGPFSLWRYREWMMRRRWRSLRGNRDR